jgi:hypothetical protein
MMSSVFLEVKCMCWSRYAFALLAACVSISGFAKSVNLYEQPQTTSKVVGTMPSDNPMVPIISSKDGQWMKVGNPANGAVGWVKSSDLTNNNQGFSFSQQTVNTGDGPKTTIQFGVPTTLSADQIKEMQKRQAEVQKSVQKIMDDMYSNIHRLYGNITTGAYPIFMPMIVVPAQLVQPTAPASSTPAAPVPAKPVPAKVSAPAVPPADQQPE